MSKVPIPPEHEELAQKLLSTPTGGPAGQSRSRAAKLLAWLPWVIAIALVGAVAAVVWANWRQLRELNLLHRQMESLPE